MNNPKPHSFKVVLLGDGRVGKTSLVLRYVNDIFNDQQQATVQASFLTKRILIRGLPITLSIWDTAGQERFHALGPIYYRDADAALLVYDIMDNDSFIRVTNWVKELQQMASKSIIMAIAANKSDLVRAKQFNLEEAESYATSIGAKLFMTSAKVGTGIDEVFLDIATIIYFSQEYCRKSLVLKVYLLLVQRKGCSS
ncbi:ras-related protein Rab-21-like isoform X2 [Papaver somniferum]|uniref:ras-related protein Rab-21-like isoform X2 n=1 Tax=Papaver somniferum TaxID=3469 RepID=UPI000E6F4899|nr:ras-related protein Rab-21-like isoform X2 [Papaver somniferum]